MAKKKLQVSLKPIAQKIEEAINSLSGFQNQVSAADKKRINLKIKRLNSAIRDVKAACTDKKMTPGFNVAKP
jgi:hypothetical protein